MRTQVAERFRQTAQGIEAEGIVRSCVHCGFCNATCPTYRLLGDERDGPRGRIYLIKEFLEGGEVSERTRLHLDRCLSCRSCETTCPSGVRYGRLVDIARGMLAEEIERPVFDRWLRRLLRFWLPYRRRFGPVWRLLQAARSVLPAKLRRRIFPSSPAKPWPEPRHGRRMLVLDGCVQPLLAPSIDAAAARLLDRLGISLMRAPGSGCCGALSYHLDAQDEGLAFMRRNIDAWWPWIERGIEAIVVTASGCGVWIKEYGELLRWDPEYAEKAARVSALARDPAEVLSGEDWRSLKQGGKRRIAFHSPCTLQHGQRLSGVVEPLLRGVGFELTPVRDPHLCCGAAGAYSILQPELASRLLDDKLAALQAGQPDGIATANIGCLVHLASGAEVPVRHWLEWLDG